MYEEEDAMPVFELQELADQIEIFLEETENETGNMDVRKQYRRSFYDLLVAS